MRTFIRSQRFFAISARYVAIALLSVYPGIGVAQPAPSTPSTGPLSVACTAEPNNPPAHSYVLNVPSFGPNCCMSPFDRCSSQCVGGSSACAPDWSTDVWTKDGKNTYAKSQGSDFHTSQGYGASGYQCYEFAARFWKMSYRLDINSWPGGKLAGDLCVGGSAVVPPDQAKQYPNDGSYTPKCGDLVVWHPHIAVIAGVDAPHKKLTIVNQNTGGGDGYSPGVPWDANQGDGNGAACAFIHALNNTSTETQCISSSNGSLGQNSPYALVGYYTGPSVAMDGKGKLVVFVRASDGNIYYKAQTAVNGGGQANGFSQWEADWKNITNPTPSNPNGTPPPAGALAASDPIAVSRGNLLNSTTSTGGMANNMLPAGHIEVFYVGTDSNIYHLWQTNANTDGVDQNPSYPDQWHWSAPAQIKTGTHPAYGQIGLLAATQGVPMSAIYYIDQYQQIFELHDSNYGSMDYTVGQMPYTWTAPKAITKKNASLSNVTAVIDTTGNPMLFFADPDRRIMTMVGGGGADPGQFMTQPIQVGTGQTQGTMPAPPNAMPSTPAGVTSAQVSAGTGPGAATSDIAVAFDFSGNVNKSGSGGGDVTGLSVFWRAADGTIYMAPPTPGICGTGFIDPRLCRDPSMRQWDGTWLAPIPLKGHSTSDITTSQGLAQMTYVQLFARSDTETVTSIKQAGNTKPASVRYQDHFEPLVLTSNSGGLLLLKDRAYSPIAQAYNLDMRSEIFYIDWQGNISTAWEQTVAVEPAVKPNDRYPIWSKPEGLESPVAGAASGSFAPTLAGYNPICNYITNGGIDAPGGAFLISKEALIKGCYDDGYGNLTWGIGTLPSTQNWCMINGVKHDGVCPSLKLPDGLCGQQERGSSSSRNCGVSQTDFPACAENTLITKNLEFMKTVVNEILQATGKQCADIQITQNQYDALADNAWQCGPGTGGCTGPAIRAFAGSSPPWQAVADAMSATSSVRAPTPRAWEDAYIFCLGSGNGTTPGCTSSPKPPSFKFGTQTLP